MTPTDRIEIIANELYSPTGKIGDFLYPLKEMPQWIINSAILQFLDEILLKVEIKTPEKSNGEQST